MIIFLYGQDTYRSRQKLNEIIAHYKKIHKSGLNLKYFDGKELNPEDFRDEIQQISMFAEKKLIILKDVLGGGRVASNREFEERLLKDSKNPTKSWWGAKDVILFFEAGEVPGGDRLFKLLKKHGKSQEFKPLGGEQLRRWVKKEFAKLKTEITPEGLNKLIEFVGNDLWQMSNEIKKLVSYRAPRAARRRDKSLLNLRSASPRSVGEGGKENEVLFDHKKGARIETEDIERLVKSKIETDIFKTIDAIASKNKTKALSLIHKHLEKGDSPLYLLSMINFQFRNILALKDLMERGEPYQVILSQSKLHPYVIKKSYSQAQRFSIDELKKIYQKIFQGDLNIKTGKVEPEIALDLLIAEI